MAIIELLYKELSKHSHELLKHIVKEIPQRDNILICAHATPDGDALASSSALGYICKHLGKKFTLYNESEIPAFLDFIPLSAKVEHAIEHLPFKPELLIILDCGDRKRLGTLSDKVLKLAPSINIDHHLANPNFGTLINWVDTSMVATGNAIAYIALELGIPLTNELGFCLYTSIVTDSGSFAHGNTNTRAFLTASLIVSLGLNPSKVSSALNNNWTEEKTKLWAHLLSSYTLNKDLSLAYILISRSVLEDFKCAKSDIEGFVEQLRKIKSVRIACVLREEEAFDIRASFRSEGADNVQMIATHFGGGGHKNAAGAKIKTSLACARDQILDIIRKKKDLIFSK